jgi:hypothetical protein
MGNEGQKKEKTSGYFTARIGTFLILLGIFFFIIFIASDLAEQPDFDWLFLGLVLLVFGLLLRRRAPPPPSSGRFAWIKRRRSQAKNRSDENQDSGADQK